MKKKVVAAMLVTCMAVSLTACGSKDSSDKTDKTTAKTETASDNSDRTRQIPRLLIPRRKRQELFR